MEIDPNYEFEAPKWVDFTADFEDELNELSLNSSWFEKVHPLHEPKDPLHHDATAKPLLASAQVEKPATNSKPQSHKLKKNYNSKKSLGIKSIRTQRGEHEGMNIRENSGKGQRDVKSLTAKNDDKKTTQRISSEEGNLTPERLLKHHKQCSFTPPWINSPQNRPESASQAKKRDGRSCSLNNMAVFSPQRVPTNQSPMSPVPVRSVKQSYAESASSPKTSLLSKAVSGSQKGNQPRRKRRLLPATPSMNKNSPGGIYTSPASPSQLGHQIGGKEGKMNDQMSCKEAACSVSSMPLRAVDKSQAVTQEHLPGHLQSNSTIKREFQDKNMFSQRPLEAIHENSTSKGKPSQSLAQTDSEKNTSPKRKTVMQSNDLSLEALLKQHNKKIAAARNQYDENGRKIRTAQPNFCPAPGHKTFSSSSSVISPSTACKRPSTSAEPVVGVKQKRRSCVAAMSSTQTELATLKKNLSSNINRKGKEDVCQQTAKQKRRSCVATFGNGGHAKLDKELRDLIAQHNSKVKAKRS